MDEFLKDLEEDDENDQPSEKPKQEKEEHREADDSLTIQILKDATFLKHLKDVEKCLNDEIL